MVFFAVGTGRCGTHFFNNLFHGHSEVASHHERSRFNDTFHRFCKWHGISVDHEGFLDVKRKLIQKDLNKHRVSFEASAYLSLSIEELYKEFNAHFILLIRNPVDVINSYLRKGWYKEDYKRESNNMPPTYQYGMKPHHFLGRIVPNGAKFNEWKRMGRPGKLGWYWNALNQSVLEQFDRIDPEHSHIFRIEDFNFAEYQQLCKKMDIPAHHNKESFTELVNSRPDSNKSGKNGDEYYWSNKDHKEVKEEIWQIATKFNYPKSKDEILI